MNGESYEFLDLFAKWFKSESITFYFINNILKYIYQLQMQVLYYEV